ncbi:MAG: hypothetical protein Q7J79_01290 [Gemmatimonadales bacterium]|nr:hypothetical protein [Gemmatimonadales bacterium]
MWFKHRGWIPVAWLLSLANVVSVWFAAQPAETWHATIHALLAVLFGLGAQRLAARRKPAADADVVERSSELEARLADLDKLQGVEGRLTELEERLDFTERALVDVRTRAQLPPKQ